MMKMNKTFVVLLTALTLALISPFANSAGKDTKSETVVLSKSNTIVLSGEVNAENASAVISQAKALGNVRSRFGKEKPLYLFLNTPGGSIQTGLEIIESLNGLDRPISTVTLFAASMGFQIAQNLGPRLILKNGVLMSHRASGQFSGNFGGQNPSQIDSRYGLWLSRLKELDEQTVSRTKGKQTLESYQKAYADELWLTGAQSVAGGYADEIVTVRCDSSLDGVTTHAVSFLGINIYYDLDNCPLNTSPMNVRIGDKFKNLSEDQIEELTEKFLQSYLSKHRSVVPMYW
jgi:ATP-dependent Clp protease, protease subunit